MNVGDIYNVRFSGQGSQQDGIRPAVIVQSVLGIKHSPVIKVVPLTSSPNKINKHLEHPFPTHVFLDAKKYGLKRDSIVLCEQSKKVTKEDILEKFSIDTLPPEIMIKIALAQMADDGSFAYLDVESFTRLLKELKVNNNVKI